MNRRKINFKKADNQTYSLVVYAQLSMSRMH